MGKPYQATDGDLPTELWAPNKLTQARERIAVMVDELGIKVDAASINTFAIVLVALEETEGPADR